MSYPPPGPPPYQGYPPGAFGYYPTPVMMPYPPPPPPGASNPQVTYITNHVYNQHPEPGSEVHFVEHAAPEPELIDWLPVTRSTASTLTGKALVVGREGWDGSPLWAIRAHHNGDCIPGKLAIKHRAAYIPNAGVEVPVHEFEVLVAPAHQVRWVPANNGQVPVGAIIGGNTHSAEPLYIGRVRHRGSVTPGKVHPSHGCCYICFSGTELSFKYYEVLCRISESGPTPR